MSFPDTRLTLIQRIAADGQAADWRQFLHDYWGPICRFAASRGPINAADAEDVASQVFEALLTNQLLVRWSTHRSAKLRTLLCAVTRNVMANRARVGQGRARLVREQFAQGRLAPLAAGRDEPREQVDSFYAAWADELLGSAVETLVHELHAEGKGDYFRVLYGRICEQMTTAEVAGSLGIKLTYTENYFRAARKRLAATLEDLVRRHVEHYCPDAERGDEFAAEWRHLGDYLTARGGLEAAVRRAHAAFDPTARPERRAARIDEALSRIVPPVTDSPAPLHE